MDLQATAWSRRLDQIPRRPHADPQCVHWGRKEVRRDRVAISSKSG